MRVHREVIPPMICFLVMSALYFFSKHLYNQTSSLIPPYSVSYSSLFLCPAARVASTGLFWTYLLLFFYLLKTQLGPLSMYTKDLIQLRNKKQKGEVNNSRRMKKKACGTCE